MTMYQHEMSEADGYELFRRAIVECSGDAWASIYRNYRPLLVAWSRQSSMRAPSTESVDDIVDHALARAWAALTPERFANFGSLAALLGYLRTCVTATVIDASRLDASRDRAIQRLEPQTYPTPEQYVIGYSERTAMWQAISSLISCERERIVLVESYVLALAPRQIHERHPHLFANTTAVYSTKRNIINRLIRSPIIQKLYLDMCA